jgi:CheY-like chemotaxis protein
MKPMPNVSSLAGPPVAAVTPLDVLLVDDDREIGQLMVRFLLKSGYTAECANNGQAALRILHRRQVAVVVTDILMPEVDGYELIMQLRQAPHRPAIVAMSGNPSKIGMDFLKSARQLGADHVLPKPFLPQELVGLVREILGPPAQPGATL